MLTNLVEGGGFTCIKCNMYWPESVGDTKRFGDIEVQLFDKAEVMDETKIDDDDDDDDLLHRPPTT